MYFFHRIQPSWTHALPFWAWMSLTASLVAGPTPQSAYGQQLGEDAWSLSLERANLRLEDAFSARFYAPFSFRPHQMLRGLGLQAAAHWGYWQASLGVARLGSRAGARRQFVSAPDVDPATNPTTAAPEQAPFAVDARTTLTHVEAAAARGFPFRLLNGSWSYLIGARVGLLYSNQEVTDARLNTEAGRSAWGADLSDWSTTIGLEIGLYWHVSKRWAVLSNYVHRRGRIEASHEHASRPGVSLQSQQSLRGSFRIGVCYRRFTS